jgi:hypothetical protein
VLDSGSRLKHNNANLTNRRWAMIRGLKVLLIVLGVIHIFEGLVVILAPQLFANIWGVGEMEIADYVRYIMALLGISLIAPAVWLIAAARDPLRHITWVKYAMLMSILGVVVQLYLVVKGTVDFSQAATGIVIGAVFAAAFLILYPYRAARSS